MTQKHLLVFISVMVIGLSLCFVGLQPVCAESDDILFTTTLIVPISNPARVLHAQVIAHELPKIGIQVKLLFYDWDAYLPRVFESPGPLVLNYEDGGYDMACIGWYRLELMPTTQHWLFHSTQTPSFNYFGVQNAYLDGLLEKSINTTDINQRKQYIEDAWEYLTWQVQAEITLYQTKIAVYMRDNVKNYSYKLRFPEGDGKIYFNCLSIAEMYFNDGQSQGHGNVNEFIMASTTRPARYNDLIEDDWFNQLVIGPLNHGLVESDSDYGFIPVLLTQLPYPVAIKNNHTSIVSPTAPNFATVWEVELRDDVYWHEGYGYTNASHADTLRVDSDDVNFTFQLILDNNGPSPCAERAAWQNLLGTDAELAVVPVNRTHVQFHIMNLNANMLDLFRQKLLPQHILELGTVRADGSVAPSDYPSWHGDDWNIGYRTGGYVGPAVIGNGPYILSPGENSIAQTVTETKNPYWFLKDELAYANMFDKYIYTWISSKDEALTALENGDIDLIDPQYWNTNSPEYVRDYSIMKNKPNIFIQKELNWGCQTMGINTRYGAGGSKGLQNLNVRLAISHMIPRQDMANYLFGGLAQPAFMHIPRQNFFYPTGVEPIVYNVTKAIEYMEAAGHNMGSYKSPHAPDSHETPNDGRFVTNPVDPDGLFGSLVNNGVLSPGLTLVVEALVVCVVMSSLTGTVLVYRHRQRQQELRAKEEN